MLRLQIYYNSNTQKIPQWFQKYVRIWTDFRLEADKISEFKASGAAQSNQPVKMLYQLSCVIMVIYADIIDLFELLLRLDLQHIQSVC